MKKITLIFFIFNSKFRHLFLYCKRFGKNFFKKFFQPIFAFVSVDYNHFKWLFSLIFVNFFLQRKS